jgi:hypothetical protein
MSSTYNNLSTIEDWTGLFSHLLVRSKWCDEPSGERFDIILNQLFGGQLVNATVFLLHALTPIRFAFMDGQARMTTLHYVLRKLVPRIDGGVAPISHLTDKEIKVKLSQTSQPAVCIFAQDDNDGGPITVEFMSSLRGNSRKEMDKLTKTKQDLITMTPSNLSDAIVEMMDSVPHSEQPITVSNLLQRVDDMFLHVIATLRKFDKPLSNKIFRKIRGADVLESDEKFIADVFEKLHPKPKAKQTRKIFPSLLSNPTGGSTELTVLMYMVGAALCSTNSRRYLKQCMHKEWVVPIVDPAQVHGVPLDRLHKGTFVNPSMKVDQYQNELHNVSLVTAPKHPIRGDFQITKSL